MKEDRLRGVIENQTPGVGDAAPDFELPALVSGVKQPLRLSAYRGEKNVVLAFYPFNWQETSCNPVDQLPGAASASAGEQRGNRGHYGGFHHEHHGLGTRDRPVRISVVQRFLAARRSLGTLRGFAEIREKIRRWHGFERAGGGDSGSQRNRRLSQDLRPGPSCTGRGSSNAAGTNLSHSCLEGAP